MQFAGDKNRIQALFSEMSLEDHSQAPRFERLWNRAELTRRAHSSDFRSAVLVIVSALAVVTVGSLAVWWSRSRPANPPADSAVKIVPEVISIPPVPEVYDGLNPKPATVHIPARKKRSARQPATERAITYESALLSNWESPTKIFMESPTVVVLNSLPRLNESAEDLRSFLPRSNESKKESNK